MGVLFRPHLLYVLFVLSCPAATVTRGPYLQLCTPTGIVVRWRTDEPTDSRVRCGVNPSELDLSFEDAAVTTEHQVSLSGLQPRTRYHYAIGTSGAVLKSSANFFFDTFPPPGQPRPTRIWFLSDYGFGDLYEIAVRNSYFHFAINHGPADLWLTGGDNDQIVGDDAHIQSSIFDIYGLLLSSLPIWPTLGNHDTYTKSVPGPYPYFDNFTLPTQGEAGGLASGSEHYYSFDYANIHLVTLDSIEPAHSAGPDTPMLQWLSHDLAATTQRWKIAFWHAPPYSKGSHDSDNPNDRTGYSVQMRQHALPILEAAGVDLVLCGHSHVYERSCLLHGHYGDSSTFSPTHQVNPGDGRANGDGPYRQVEGKGTVYVVAGVGGDPRGFHFGSHPAHVVNIGTELGSCVLDVKGDRLDFQFINDRAETLDYFTMLKEDPLRIVAYEITATSISLTWNTVPAQWYQVLRAEALAGPWEAAGGPVLADSAQGAWSSPLVPGDPQRFYRVTRLP